ncbi:hypothetical protein P171DRAFT_521297 [Karstenula rhodostoma CBS 690.94]|uniref:Extracellular membrane protein CFEM domain-containing protein n=1 Tax=Karstenula rhodostoma CBS 690.94 TaxID=1392251 RepID=A0A9P4UDL6_9PLEO|nr:hypothetical protein P171DRAFT_521297 [Karstenula rhodostoma CBS 690.94]
MVNLILVVMTITSLVATTIAAPSSITGELTFPFMQRDLEAREIDHRACINCKAVCHAASSRYPLRADVEACQTVCKRHDDTCEWMDSKQQNTYLNAYFGLNWQEIPGLLEKWEKFNGQPAASANTALPQLANTVTDEVSNTTLHHLEKRKSLRVNCKAICSEDSSVHSPCACKAVCHNHKNTKDCKEKIHRMSKIKKFLKCYFPDKYEEMYNDCEHEKHRHKCFQDMINDDFDQISGHRHSHEDC